MVSSLMPAGLQLIRKACSPFLFACESSSSLPAAWSSCLPDRYVWGTEKSLEIWMSSGSKRTMVSSYPCRFWPWRNILRSKKSCVWVDNWFVRWADFSYEYITLFVRMIKYCSCETVLHFIKWDVSSHLVLYLSILKKFIMKSHVDILETYHEA